MKTSHGQLLHQLWEGGFEICGKNRGAVHNEVIGLCEYSTLYHSQ